MRWNRSTSSAVWRRVAASRRAVLCNCPRYRLRSAPRWRYHWWHTFWGFGRYSGISALPLRKSFFSSAILSKRSATMGFLLCDCPELMLVAPILADWLDGARAPLPRPPSCDVPALCCGTKTLVSVCAVALTFFCPSFRRGLLLGECCIIFLQALIPRRIQWRQLRPNMTCAACVRSTPRVRWKSPGDQIYRLQAASNANVRSSAVRCDCNLRSPGNSLANDRQIPKP